MATSSLRQRHHNWHPADSHVNCVQLSWEPADPCYRQWCALHFCILHVFLTGNTDNTPQVFTLYSAPKGVIELFNFALKPNGQRTASAVETRFDRLPVRLLLHSACHHWLISYELLHSRPMTTKLIVLPPPPVLHHTQRWTFATVSVQQQKMKTYTNSRWGARPTVPPKRGQSACLEPSACHERSQKV